MAMLGIIGSYEEAWKSIIMPERQEYTLSNLGPTDFPVRNIRVQRLDFKLQNRRGHILECSFYQRLEGEEPCPCVVYLHGNGCSRIEALQYVDLVMGQSLSFFSFDFTACGKSEGTYSSVGWFEQDDLDCILNFLYGTGKVNRVCLWGRSMGATTALLYSAKNPKVDCLILDSAFANFKKLIKEIAKKSIPGFLTDGAFKMIRKTIEKHAKFDINELRPIEYVSNIQLPALFGAAKNDDFVQPHHTQDLFAVYNGEKTIEIFDGDHNSLRPFIWRKIVSDFLKKHLLSPKSEIQSNLNRSEQTTKQNFPSQISNIEGENVKRGQVKPADNRSRSPGKITPRAMQFSWLQNASSFSGLLEKEPKQSDKNKENNGVGGSSPKRDFYLKGHTTHTMSATSILTGNGTGTGIMFDSSPRINSKIFTDSYFTSNMKTEYEDLESEKSIISNRLWQHDNAKALLGPKLVSSNAEPQNDLQKPIPSVRLRVDKNGSEMTRSISLSSKGWTAQAPTMDSVSNFSQTNLEVPEKDQAETQAKKSIQQLLEVHHHNKTHSYTSRPPFSSSANDTFQRPASHRVQGNHHLSSFSHVESFGVEKDSSVKLASQNKESIQQDSKKHKVIQIKFDINAPITYSLKSSFGNSSKPPFQQTGAPKTTSINLNQFGLVGNLVSAKQEGIQSHGLDAKSHNINSSEYLFEKRKSSLGSDQYPMGSHNVGK